MERYIPAFRRAAVRPEEVQERPEPTPRGGSLPRYKPQPRPAPAKPEQKAKPEWHKAYLVPALLKHPPIRHRGDPSEAGLEPFEFVLGATAIIIARVKVGRLRKIYIDKQVQKAFGGARSKMKPGKTNRALFQRIGRETRRKARASFPWPTGATVIRLYRRELFRIAGLSRNAVNLGRLVAALDRLKQPTTKHLPPLLLTHGRAEDGRLRLEVNPEWVPRGGYDDVPWPPPAAPIVLALYLFAFGTEQRGNTSIRFETLYKRLGIDQRYGRKSLGRALESVNSHLAWLYDKGWFAKPIRFELVASRDGTRVHIAEEEQQQEAKASPQVEVDVDEPSVTRRAS
jgi:hypothetical protein